ncbi:hypothetical protein [Hyalangium versicolor]|uniref:hypothetical protein n=1 Tax=Hyalangium versicolor TaxID=2861190 RepID=UPI001CC9F33A|nr:hypothetical protein [Hyalangium versicolor]
MSQLQVDGLALAMTVLMPHVVVRAVELLDGDTSKPLNPGPHVPDVLNLFFTLLEREFIQR